MTEWINRQSESMREASRALKRAQKEQVRPHATSDTVTSESGRASRHRGPTWGTSSQDNSEQPVVFDDRGRLPEEEEEGEEEEDDDDHLEHLQSHDAWSSQSWKNYGWNDWYQNDWQQDEWQSGRSAEFRANVLAAIGGEFSLKNVEKALQEQWRDDDLAKRDRAKHMPTSPWRRRRRRILKKKALLLTLRPRILLKTLRGMKPSWESSKKSILPCKPSRTRGGLSKRRGGDSKQVKMNRKFYPTSSYKPPPRCLPAPILC